MCHSLFSPSSSRFWFPSGFRSTRQGSPVPPYSTGLPQRLPSTNTSSTQQTEGGFSYPTEKGCETAPPLDTPLHQQVVDKMHNFWTTFRDNFISGLPILPPFLLTRFSTALIRCFEPNSEKVNAAKSYGLIENILDKWQA